MSSIRIVLRSLAATPGPSLLIVLTMAIAIGAATSIFSVLSGILMMPLGYGDDSRLVVVWGQTESSGSDFFRLSPADYRDVRDSVDAFAGQVALYRSIGSTLTGREEPVRVGSLRVTPRLFDVLAANPAAGRFFGKEDEDPGAGTGQTAVITHRSWTQDFGADPQLVGKSVEIDGLPYTIVGITREDFSFPPGSDVDMYFPMALSDAILLDRDHRMFDAIARLDDGISAEAARAELASLASRLAQEFPTTNTGWSLTVSDLRGEIAGDLGGTFSVLFAAVLLVLLVACANVAGILLVRSTTATRDNAIHVALGARPADLAKRSLAESTVLGLAGGTLGILLAVGGVRVLKVSLPPDIPRLDGITLNPTALVLGTMLTVGSVLLFGSLPAIRGSRRFRRGSTALEGLRTFSSNIKNRGAGAARMVLVTVEVAVAVVLIVATGLMLRSVWQIGEIDPGFDPENVTSAAVQLPTSRYQRTEFRDTFDSLLAAIESTPGIDAAGAVSDLPMSSVGLGFELELTTSGLDARVPSSSRPNADVRLVLPGYFEAMGMRMTGGRDLVDTDREANVAVVNETLARRIFGDIDPLGRSVELELFGETRIVGVVGDVRHGGLMALHEAEIYLPYGRVATNEMHLVVKSRLPEDAVVAGLIARLGELDPQLVPTEVASLSDRVWQSAARPRFTATLLSLLAIAAVALAAIGTYGVVAFAVAQRESEIGVRMALGASGGATVRAVLLATSKLVGIGAIIGLALAAVLTRPMSQLLYEVTATDPWIYLAAVAVALLVGMLAAAVPARRAVSVDPVRAIRAES